MSNPAIITSLFICYSGSAWSQAQDSLETHLVTRKEIYKRFEWLDPLSYVVAGPDLRIHYLESAFDVHSIRPIEKSIQTLLSKQ